MPATHEHLPHAPVSDVVFDLRMETERAYGLIPGALAPSIEGLFPMYTELPGAQIVNMGVPITSPLACHHFSDEAGQRIVLLGPKFFALHLRNYGGWSEFRRTLSGVLEPYLRASQAVTVSRIAVRYVNALPAGAGVFHGIAATVQWPAIEHFVMKSAAVRGVFAVADPPGEIGVAFNGDNPGQTKLDLDLWSLPNEGMGLAEILAWADKAHERVYEAFAGMITPAAHDSFRSGGV